MTYEFHDEGATLTVKGELGDLGLVGITLNELIDNGNAVRNEDEVFVPHEEIASLSVHERELLGLPTRYEGKIFCQSEGQLNEETFGFKLSFRAHVDGNDLNGSVKGAFLTTSTAVFTLSESHYQFSRIVNRHAQEAIRNSAKNYSTLAELKAIAAESGTKSIHFDNYLDEENAILPEQFGLSMEKDSSGNLQVSANIRDAPWFEEKFSKFPRVRGMYTAQDEQGNRIRVPIQESHREPLENVKKLKQIPPDVMKDFIEHPEEFLDPDVINLDDFSERVVELGLYSPKYYPFISKYKSDWIPGILIEQSAGERTKLPIESEEELNDLEKLVGDAQRNERDEVQWKGHSLPVEQLKDTIHIARKQFRNPKAPVTDTEDKRDKRVLIIHENVEDLTFGGADATPQTLEHVFEDVPGLSDDYALYPHQREGIAWMQSAVRRKLTGVLLADDMGLGKTIQILCLVQWHNELLNDARKPYLVVAPVALLENWEREFRLYFPSSAIMIDPVHGSTARDISKESLSGHAIYLTTYETLRRKQKAFCAVDWAIVTLDEAQKVKTPGTLVTNAVKALKTDFMVPMTGTPVENSLMDMWCIVDACAPGLLGSASEFSKIYQKPLEFEDTDVAALGDELRRNIGIYIKRRLKTDELKGLPEKEERRLEVSMPVNQITRYDQILSNFQKAKESPDFSRGTILKLLMAMRETCDHPHLHDESHESMSADQLLNSSAKLQATFERLREIESMAEKVIIFSTLKKTQRMLAQFCKEAFNLSTVSIVNGETPASSTGKERSKISRQGAIDRFQAVEGFNIIIMSPLAAGFGLNVTGANHVIHYTRHWNPAKESQATDRAYRIGQDKKVFVYYPMSVSSTYRTFDIVLDDLLSRKQDLATASLFPSERATVHENDLADALLGRTDD